MQGKTVNILTTLIGLAITIAAPISVFIYPEQIGWWSCLGGILAGATLVFVKDEKFSELLSGYINKGVK